MVLTAMVNNVFLSTMIYKAFGSYSVQYSVQCTVQYTLFYTIFLGMWGVYALNRI